MNWLEKSTVSVRARSGLEWTIWRKLPLIAIAGTMLPILLAAALHFVIENDTDSAQLRWLQVVDFVVVAVVIFHWTMVLTVGIGCCIVMVMKGPGYTADSYQVSHSDHPRRLQETDTEAAAHRAKIQPSKQADMP
jgi:hypothetical protein